MSSPASEIGRRGEDAVCEYLLASGHSILERNWRKGHLEVDIISLAEDGVHFVEVKSRVAPAAADPADSVRSAKRKNITRAALAYMAQAGEGIGEMEIWLDVAGVIFDGSLLTIDYMPGAYIPMYY